jgi:hypothetical protein
MKWSSKEPGKEEASKASGSFVASCLSAGNGENRQYSGNGYPGGWLRTSL